MNINSWECCCDLHRAHMCRPAQRKQWRTCVFALSCPGAGAALFWKSGDWDASIPCNELLDTEQDPNQWPKPQPVGLYIHDIAELTIGNQESQSVPMSADFCSLGSPALLLLLPLILVAVVMCMDHPNVHVAMTQPVTANPSQKTHCISN